MAYCTKDNILKDFKKLAVENSGTIIINSQLNQIILEESEYIDARITKRYYLPILEADYPKAFEVLRRIAIFRVSLRVRNILEVRSDATQADSDEKYKMNGVRTPNDDLDDIDKGILVLIDVPQKKMGMNNNEKAFCGGEFKIKVDQW